LSAPQRIVRERRQYNQWVATQTLEDYALRYTADKARKSSFRVGNTALGPISFLACEAIGGAITISYGFSNSVWAIVAFGVLMFLIGLPIAYHAARAGVDIDLLTRGAGFGYMGSTITSLIYASFTFLLFAIEASIMSMALHMLFNLPLAVAHLISSLVVIPIAIFGFRLISRMQMWTQPVWLLLQFLPIIYIAWQSPADVAGWTHYSGKQGSADGSLDPLLFGAATAVLLSLLPQIGEQVDYLRFLPNRNSSNQAGWWGALLATGPGWVFIGGFKLLVGSFLAVVAIKHGVPLEQASQPTDMYYMAFTRTFNSPSFALVLMGVFVIVCQLKINVTNAYAGSIAWSNFFSRLTHSHPGRVVWLVFNVLLALLLMEIGIFRAIESILVIYANFAAGWIGALTADLVINKPLGLSPKHIEFKRAHLYDINPVGVGALIISVLLSSLALLGLFGHLLQVIAPIVALLVAFITAPLIAWATDGRYYLARRDDELADEAAQQSEIRCSICENHFERNDIAFCPAYSGPICSLCCTLEARCRDLCKQDSRLSEQLTQWVSKLLPQPVALLLHTRAGQFFGLMLLFNLAIGFLLALINQQYSASLPTARAVISDTLWLVFLCFMVFSGVAAWLIVLAHESRRTAEAESARQTSMLMEEIEAHQRTDAELQKAKEVAEAANLAKSRYIVGLSHEIRTPLNSIFGYAQLLERGATTHSENSVRVIRRSAEHLANLIDGLLDISKIEGGLLKLNRDKVQLQDFLDQIVNMFRLQAAAKGIEFRTQWPANLPAYVHTDQKRLRQILINLLSNAIKYTQRGHAAFSLQYRSQVAEFVISDTGMGIPDNELERVFQPFERGQAMDVRQIPGTGLGLTITKLLTQIMGGEIQVDSKPGVGTRFTVRLMLSEASPSATDLLLPQRVNDYVGPRIKLLVVDDDPTHIDIVRHLLEPLNFSLFAAGNGHEGLQRALECQPDLAMIDISMPDMKGWELADKLREQAALQGLKIMMVSANAHEFHAGGEGHAHDAFVMKPIDLQALLESIGSLLRLKWIYDIPAVVDESGDSGATVPDHARQHLDDLFQLGRIGHVRGIQSKLQEIEAEHADNKRFVAQLRGLMANFDLRRFMNTLQGMRNNG
jgi:signal transduction histidine kinase/CheY-like chemotaxis protein/purine-cytosine permease-like protein